MDPLPHVNASGLRVERRLVVAFVAYRTATTDATPVSQRYLQKALVRASRGSAATTLKGLVQNGWLEIAQTYTPLTPMHYRLGPEIADVERPNWQEIGRRLYNPADGSLGHFLATPAIKWGHLGPAAMLVIGTCMEEGPVDRPELVRCLEPLVSRTGLCNSDGVLDRLKRYGLLAESSDGILVVPDDIKMRLPQYEVDSGARAKTQRVHGQIAAEQARNREQHLGSVDVQRYVAWLRTQPCEVCGRVPSGSGGEVEHWPPKKLGGFEAVGLLRPICTRCNNRLSQRVKQMPVAQQEAGVDSITTFTDEPEGMAQFAQDLLDLSYLDHIFEFEDSESVRNRLDEDFAFWLAMHGHGIQGVIIDTGTGAVLDVDSADPNFYHRGPT